MGACRIRIVSRDNGVGLSRDMALMAEALQGEDARIERVGFGNGKGGNALREAGLVLERHWRGPVDVQLFSERVYPRCLPLARCNVLVPNPEWFLPKWLPLLPAFDEVLCKTRHAERLFRELGCRTRFVGFTSEDRLMPDVPREPVFFHLAGRSRAKGTQVLLDTWRDHPEWPLLTVVQNPRTAGPRVHAPNIDHRIGYLDDAELRRLQNAHAFHVCPSEVEGFGHYLMEAMSVGAVVLATDAEPMNELVPAFHGIPIPVYRSRLQGLVPHHYVAPAGIELAVETALGLTEGQRQRFAQRARTHFLATREAFHARFRHALDELARAPLASMMAGSGAA